MIAMAMVNALMINVYVIKDSQELIVVREHVMIITALEMVYVIREYVFVTLALQEITVNTLFVLFQIVHRMESAME